jgi:hypothetical protein
LRSVPSAKVVVMIESAAGETIAPPRPWTPRATISQPSDWARPPASDAREKRIRPRMNIRRRPIRSARRPPRSRKPPKVRVYALTTHERSLWVKDRARPIEGRATLTIDASMTITNCVMASRASAMLRSRGVSRMPVMAGRRAITGSLRPAGT